MFNRLEPDTRRSLGITAGLLLLIGVALAGMRHRPEEVNKPRSHAPGRQATSMTPLERITERVNRNGPVEDETTPRPLLTLAEFFDGNDVVGSIGCNLPSMPTPAEMRAQLERIAAKPGVVEVRVQITYFDDPEWPFSDTVWIITDADPATVLSWFDESFRPDDCWRGWQADQSYEPYSMPAGMSAVGCWWD